MHRRDPVTARLRDQSDAPLVIVTAPMAINGENGSSQNKATLRTASSFAIRPGNASATTMCMAQAPVPEQQDFQDWRRLVHLSRSSCFDGWWRGPNLTSNRGYTRR